MEHPFKDKLVVFIGTPQSCTRQAARDALTAIGGIPDSQITAFINYVVAFEGAEKTKMYRSALKLEKHGLLSILSEEQYSAILAGEAEPPAMPERDNGVVVIPAKDDEAVAREFEQTKEMILNQKRMNNLARHGVLTEEGRVKVDLRPLDKLNRVIKKLNEQESS